MAQWQELIYDSIYLDGRETVTGQGSEADVSFEGPTGSSLTEIVSGQEYVDVREYDRISVRVDAAINGGSDDVTANLFSRLVEEASRENPGAIASSARRRRPPNRPPPINRSGAGGRSSSAGMTTQRPAPPSTTRARRRLWSY